MVSIEAVMYFEVCSFQAQTAPFAQGFALGKSCIYSSEALSLRLSRFLMDSIGKVVYFEVCSFQAQTAPFAQ